MQKLRHTHTKGERERERQRERERGVKPAMKKSYSGDEMSYDDD
jgi:hypothetical protein